MIAVNYGHLFFSVCLLIALSLSFFNSEIGDSTYCLASVKTCVRLLFRISFAKANISIHKVPDGLCIVLLLEKHFHEKV